jgi:hypothetical protein
MCFSISSNKITNTVFYERLRSIVRLHHNLHIPEAHPLSAYAVAFLVFMSIVSHFHHQINIRPMLLPILFYQLLLFQGIESSHWFFMSCNPARLTASLTASIFFLSTTTLWCNSSSSLTVSFALKHFHNWNSSPFSYDFSNIFAGHFFFINEVPLFSCNCLWKYLNVLGLLWFSITNFGYFSIIPSRSHVLLRI